MKKVLAILVTMAMILGLAACGGAAPAASSEAAAPAASSEEVAKPAESPAEGGDAAEEHEHVVIEFSGVESDWRDAWDGVKAKFEEEYPWIEVQAVNIEASADFNATRGAAGDLPDMVMMSRQQQTLLFAKEGRLKDLSDRPVAAHTPQSYIDTFTDYGITWGITRGAAFGVMYYNLDILKQAGWDKMPENWDEFIQCCQDIKDKTGVAPIAVAGKKVTPMNFILELITVNAVGEEIGGQGKFEELFKDGKFDFTAYPIIAERLAQIQPYIIEGAATMSEDDVTAAVTDGLAAMALAGNWTAGALIDGLTECTGDNALVGASLPPFNDAGKQVWATVSPEDGFCLSTDGTEAEQEAAQIFFDWLFTPENFKMVQNARGTVPVMDNLTEDMLVLSDQIKSCVPVLNSAPFVTMMFNLWTPEFKEMEVTAMKDLLGGNATAEDAVKTIWEAEQQYYYNKE